MFANGGTRLGKPCRPAVALYGADGFNLDAAAAAAVEATALSCGQGEVILLVPTSITCFCHSSNTACRVIHHMLLLSKCYHWPRP